MNIALGSDHAGFRYQQKPGELLDSLGHEVYDLGAHTEEPVNYPLFSMTTLNTVRAIVRVWLDTPFQGGRHEFRIRLLDSYFTQTVHYENPVSKRD